MMKEFLTDVETLRDRVQRATSVAALDGASPLETTVLVLNQALALNMVCVLRHMRHFVTADRFDARVVAQEFLEHTVRESENSDLIVARILELGGEPDFERDSLTSRGHFECDSSSEFEAVIREDLMAEQVAIAAYAEMISWLANVDTTSSRMLRQILSLEEEHAEVMLNFVAMVID
jgi:bacterioferritin